MKRIKVGVIGLGNRGKSLIEDVMLHMDNIEITAICDEYEDRVNTMANILKEKTGKDVETTLKDIELIHSKNVEAVIIASAWQSHVDLMIECMEANKYVASEVGGAFSIEECWKLVDTYEKTKTPCMLLENCCYGRDELMLLNMVKKEYLVKLFIALEDISMI